NHKLQMIAKELDVDEFRFTNDVYDSENRHRGLEILMEIKH
ncbi:LLM class flavin-dependent oxidoreductase, partial [Pseudoalteromonas sp. S1691]